MIRRRIEVGSALLLSLVIALGGFRLLSGPLRDLEVNAGMSLLGRLSGRISVVGDHTFQVLPSDQDAFRAHVTPFCSSLVALLALAAIALCVLRGPLARRLGAFAAAAVLIMACNVLRVAGSVWVGYEMGPSGLVLFHDWVGTVFGLSYTLAGFFLMLYLLLPSATARIPRAARVSDVL